MIDKTLAKRYRVEALIGSGGMSIVYRAWDQRTQRTVAVKVLREEYNKDAEFLRRFDREAMACAKVQHPHIVNLLDVGEEGETRFIVMEYIQGNTLKEMIMERGKLAPEEAVTLALQALSALGHAHQKHIVHRDIKPQNILVNLHGQVKIADFGIARMTDSSTVTTADGNIMGSVHYFSPEQAKGQQVTEAGDLYSMGVVLYEMLSGSVPFEGDTPVAVAMKHLNELPRPVSTLAPEVSPAIEQVLAKAMCKNIAQRYASAEQMAADLRRALRQPEGGFVRMRPAPDGTQVMRPNRPAPTGHGRTKGNRRKWRGRLLFTLTLLICVGVLSVIGYAGYNFWLRMANYVAMPGVTGLEETVALDVLRKAQIEPIVIKQRDPVVMSGFVILQEPLEGVEIARGDQATLRVSIGSEEVYIPDVLGMEQEAAEKALTDKGLSIGDVLVEISDLPVGQVIRQVPEADLLAKDGMMVDLHVSGGAVVVPELYTLPFAEASTRLEALGLAVGTITFVDVDNARLDTQVQAQDPPMGERVFPGTEVSLSVTRFDSRPFRKRVDIQVRIPASGARIRVTLVDISGVETEQYAARHIQTKLGLQPLTVELRSALSGEMTYRVYMDDVLVEEVPITFE